MTIEIVDMVNNPILITEHQPRNTLIDSMVFISILPALCWPKNILLHRCIHCCASSMCIRLTIILCITASGRSNFINTKSSDAGGTLPQGKTQIPIAEDPLRQNEDIPGVSSSSNVVNKILGAVGFSSRVFSAMGGSYLFMPVSLFERIEKRRRCCSIQRGTRPSSLKRGSNRVRDFRAGSPMSPTQKHSSEDIRRYRDAWMLLMKICDLPQCLTRSTWWNWQMTINFSNRAVFRVPDLRVCT